MYNLKRSKRKTLTITVKNDGVFVDAPLNLSLQYIENFVRKKSDWIQKKLSENYRKQQKYILAKNYEVLLIQGTEYKLVFDGSVKKIAVNKNNFSVLIPKKYYSENNKENTDLLNALKNWYKRLAHNLLFIRLSEVSEYINLPFSSFKLTNAQKKWGSCDSKNNIMLNYRLLMLDNNLIDYVIIHELCHTQQHNHSIKFYNLLEKFCPDYKARKKELKEHTVAMELFR